MKFNYYYGVDREPVDINIQKIFNLGSRELTYSKRSKTYIFDFVGFIIFKNNFLTVFPKHYTNQKHICFLNGTNKESKSDIELLFSVIRKYDETSRKTASAQKYIGPYNSYDSDYPFQSFYCVYDYFRKFGLFQEQYTHTCIGTSGKVSWKKTINKSQKIISNNNLLYIPFYVYKSENQNAFITDCMAFIIDYTLDNFNCFFKLKKTGMSKNKFDFLNNSEYVIKKLHESKMATYKDMQKKLIQSMIDFFVQINNNKANGGVIHVAIDYYDLIWQDIINSYLNKHFIGMKNNGQAINFDNSVSKSIIPFKMVTYGDIDTSYHKFHIEVDHIAYTNDELFIFDSKYHTNIETLNYKQFAYNEMLRYKYPTIKEIYSALIIPSDHEYSKVHFELSDSYVGDRKIGCRILEQYINAKEVMKDYISEPFWIDGSDWWEDIYPIVAT